MRRRRLPVCLALLLAAIPVAAHSQVSGQRPGSSEATIAVHPADNGFAALMRAGDPAVEDENTRLGKLIAVVYGGSATLTDRRAAVNSPEFRDALAQMRTALEFTLLSPTITSADELWAFSGPLRRLARFLFVESEVLFADGKTQVAIDEFAEGLQMADRAKRWGIAGVGTGQTVEAVILRRFVRHLDQLSARDCDRLFGLLRQELIAPDPAIEGFRAQPALAQWEVDQALKTLTPTNEQRNSDGELYYDSFQTLTTAERQGIVDERANNPQAIADLRSAAKQRLSALYEDVANQFASYPNEDLAPSAASADAAHHGDLVDRLVRAGSSLSTYGPGTPTALVENAVSSRARLHLLAVHTAILRWRWEHNVVPQNLTELHLGPLALDPFTGQPLVYKRIDNTHFMLASAGPPPRDDNGRVLSGAKRSPLMLETPGP